MPVRFGRWRMGDSGDGDSPRGGQGGQAGLSGCVRRRLAYDAGARRRLDWRRGRRAASRSFGRPRLDPERRPARRRERLARCGPGVHPGDEHERHPKTAARAGGNRGDNRRLARTRATGPSSRCGRSTGDCPRLPSTTGRRCTAMRPSFGRTTSVSCAPIPSSGRPSSRNHRCDRLQAPFGRCGTTVTGCGSSGRIPRQRHCGSDDKRYRLVARLLPVAAESGVRRARSDSARPVGGRTRWGPVDGRNGSRRAAAAGCLAPTGRPAPATSARTPRRLPPSGMPADRPALWSRRLGEGYSSILADGDLLVTMYREGDEEVIIALDTATGATRWEYAYHTPLVHNGYFDVWLNSAGPGPYSTPLIAGDTVFAVGVDGLFHALDKRTGELRWARDLVAAFDVVEYNAFAFESHRVRADRACAPGRQWPGGGGAGSGDRRDGVAEPRPRSRTRLARAHRGRRPGPARGGRAAGAGGPRPS